MIDELSPDFAEQFERDPRRPACQLYLISPLDVTGAFPDALKAALDAGPVAAFQFRVKGMDQHEAARLAAPLQEICAARETAFIVNDDMGLAKRLGADGVHLGQGDGDPEDARRLLGPAAQIGITCHDSRHLAMEAGRRGRTMSPSAPSSRPTTKDTHHRPDPSILSWWTTLFEIPCVAIGGITPDNGRVLVEAGADFLAVCSAVWAHPAVPRRRCGRSSAILGGKARPGREINPAPPVTPRTKALRSEQMRWFLVLVLVVGLAIGGAFATGLISFGGSQPSAPVQTATSAHAAAGPGQCRPAGRRAARRPATSRCARKTSPRPGR